MNKLILIFLFFIISIASFSQKSVFFMPSYEVPISFPDDPKYKSTIGIKAGIFNQFKKFSLGVSVGFHSFSPKRKIVSEIRNFSLPGFPTSQTSYEHIDEYGKINYIPILIEINEDLIRINDYRFYAGLNLGVMIFNYTHKVSLIDNLGNREDFRTNKTDGGGNLSVKLGFRKKVEKNISWFIESSINLHIEEYGGFATDVYESDEYMTTLIYSWSTGVGLSYTFPKRMDRESNQWLPKN